MVETHAPMRSLTSSLRTGAQRSWPSAPHAKRRAAYAVTTAWVQARGCALDNRMCGMPYAIACTSSTTSDGLVCARLVGGLEEGGGGVHSRFSSFAACARQYRDINDAMVRRFWLRPLRCASAHVNGTRQHHARPARPARSRPRLAHIQVMSVQSRRFLRCDQTCTLTTLVLHPPDNRIGRATDTHMHNSSPALRWQLHTAVHSRHKHCVRERSAYNRRS
jgi:hypothetical protein